MANIKGGRKRNYTRRKSAFKVFSDGSKNRRASEDIPLDRYLQKVTLGTEKRRADNDRD